MMKTPKFACGQIVHNVKMSQLQYTIQETPYSLYITIRNKFQKDANLNTGSEAFEILGKKNSDIIEKSEQFERMLQEIKYLKKRNKDDLVDIGRLELENEELELSNEKLESDKSVLDDKIEELYRELSDLKQNNSKDEVVRTKTKINMLENQLRESQTKLKSSSEDIELLENTLQNKCDEIEELKCELDDVKSKTKEETENYFCFSCDFICKSS